MFLNAVFMQRRLYKCSKKMGRRRKEDRRRKGEEDGTQRGRGEGKGSWEEEEGRRKLESGGIKKEDMFL
jgi:hypothetical protein